MTESWIGFWGSLIGAFIGVLGAFITAYWATKEQLKKSKKIELQNSLTIHDLDLMRELTVKLVRFSNNMYLYFSQTDSLSKFYRERQLELRSMETIALSINNREYRERLIMLDVEKERNRAISSSVFESLTVGLIVFDTSMSGDRLRPEQEYIDNLNNMTDIIDQTIIYLQNSIQEIVA